MKNMEIKMKFKPNPEYRLMDQLREVLRYYHYAYSTEQSYSSWHTWHTHGDAHEIMRFYLSDFFCSYLPHFKPYHSRKFCVIKRSVHLHLSARFSKQISTADADIIFCSFLVCIKTGYSDSCLIKQIRVLKMRYQNLHCEPPGYFRQ